MCFTFCRIFHNCLGITFIMFWSALFIIYIFTRSVWLLCHLSKLRNDIFYSFTGFLFCKYEGYVKSLKGVYVLSGSPAMNWFINFPSLTLQFLLICCQWYTLHRRYIAEILPIRHKTLFNQSIIYIEWCEKC